MPQIEGTPYDVEASQFARLQEVGLRVATMRGTGSLTPEVLSTIRKYFRIKNIYHSNAIEGNSLNVGETRTVVELGLTITGKPLKDQAEAKNLSAALDFLEELAANPNRPITEADVRQIHLLVLKGINDEEAGRYRSTIVEIGGSQYKPPSPESVAGEMDSFGQWLQQASVPSVLFESTEAVLAASAAHTWFVTIHPFIDGNGRVARLLMNLILMRFGFPIAVVTREDRLRYYDALEVSQVSDLTPFVSLISECVEESLEEYKEAANEQREKIEWAKSLASKFDQKEKTRASNQYEVWKSAMELLKNLFRQNAEFLAASSNLGEVYFRDFGMLEFEKYLSLKNFGSAKKTWFFRLDFRSGTQSARYLFFFGSPGYAAKSKTDVTLHVSREEPPGSFHYERLDVLSAPNIPSFVEIGYRVDDEAFVVRGKNGSTRTEKIESVCRRFIQEVIEKHFGT
ncbi:MAG: Fic family protein [Betaproteobacteria bacterium]|nr:Fic family protein [Betaproteobacteria bacterium]